MKKLFTILLSAVMLSLFAQQPFDYQYELPEIDTNYYHVAPTGVTNFLLDYTYLATDIDWPFTSLQPGQTLKIKFMLPAGCAYANISGESGDWQAGPGLYTSAGALDHYPDYFLLGQRPSSDTLNCYESDLSPVTAALNVVVYGNGSPSYATTDSTTYGYFSLYYPIGATGTFEFGNLRFNLLIMDVAAYTLWQEDYFGTNTAVNIVNENNEFVVFPNPASTYVQVKSNKTQVESIQVLDITGKAVLKIKSNKTKVIRLDISKLQNGVYFVKAGNTVKKLIKK